MFYKSRCISVVGNAVKLRGDDKIWSEVELFKGVLWCSLRNVMYFFALLLSCPPSLWEMSTFMIPLFYKLRSNHETVGNLFITKFLKLSGWIHAIPFACNILAFLLHLSQNSTEFDCESHWRRYHTELMSFSWVLSECFLSPSIRQLDYSPAAVSPMTEAPHSRPGTRSLTVTPMPSWGVQKCLTHCFVYAINNYLVPLVTTLLDLKPL